MKKTNRDIQKDADDLLKGTLRKLFREQGLRLGEHRSTEGEEEGVDFFFEGIEGTIGTHEFWLLNQNKGTDTKLKPIKKAEHPEKGKFSFQIDVRHARYFYFEIVEPLIFTVCDLTVNKVYWHSIQLDNEIPDRIEKSTEKDSETLQIYLLPENELNIETFPKLLIDIQNSKGNQIRKHKAKFNFKSDYDSILKETNGLHPIDKVYKTLELFQLPVIPPSIIRNIPTISGSYYKSYINQATLHTDNEEFYSLISNIELSDGKHIISDADEVEQKESKLASIITFFKVNYIHHLEYSGRNKEIKRERICVHDLFTFDECNCERCNFDRLNFISSQTILDNDSEEVSDINRLRKGYTYYLLGNLKSSINEFKKLNSNAQKGNDPIIYTVTKYNLIQLKRFLDYNYTGSDVHEIKKDLEGVNFEMDEIFIAQYAPYFLDFFNLFKNDAYFDSSFKKVDNLLSELQKISFSDKFGSRFSNSKVAELKVDFLRAVYFLEFNYVIFNSFYEYKVLVNKVLEGFIALYTLKNKHSSRYDEFDVLIIRMWMFHADLKQTNHILHKYGLRKLWVVKEDDFFVEFEKYVDNLNSSVKYVKQNIEQKNFLFFNKVERITWNLTLILSRVVLSDYQINKLIKGLLSFIEKMEHRAFLNEDAIYQLVNIQEKINVENLRKVVSLLVKLDFKLSSALSSAISGIIELESNNVLFDVLDKEFDISNYETSQLFKNDETARLICQVYNSLDKETKDRISKSVLKELQSNFTHDYYYLYSIYDIIEFDEKLFEKFIESVPDDTKKDEALKHIFGHSWHNNFRLDQLINLMYHFERPFSDEIRKLSSKSNSRLYYDWLMNLDEFDYSKFDIYWVLNYKTDSYFKAFKNSNKLMKEIENSLKKDYVEGVAKIYLKKLK